MRLTCIVVLLGLHAPCFALEVNAASEAELDGVRGLGPASTARILQAREAGGAFKDWSDFMQRVKGIKPATARKLSQSGLTVSGSPYQSVQP